MDEAAHFSALALDDENYIWRNSCNIRLQLISIHTNMHVAAAALLFF
jgi:hypothetical protein